MSYEEISWTTEEIISAFKLNQMVANVEASRVATPVRTVFSVATPGACQSSANIIPETNVLWYFKLVLTDNYGTSTVLHDYIDYSAGYQDHWWKNIPLSPDQGQAKLHLTVTWKDGIGGVETPVADCGSMETPWLGHPIFGYPTQQNVQSHFYCTGGSDCYLSFHVLARSTTYSSVYSYRPILVIHGIEAFMHREVIV